LHGRLSADEKDAVMRAFVRRDMDVLVATTVIEVGIDVPNATVMVIEHAERFGLSQLHQLRGRVGRGAHESHCLLLARFRPSEDAWRRLAIMEQTNDGFRIAEEDLAIRGPGDFVGTRQSGLPVLSLANLARDGRLLAAAREDAAALLEADPGLSAPEHAPVLEALETTWKGQLKLAQVG
jgi:ATP-dependent DNA helicase RecG